MVSTGPSTPHQPLQPAPQLRMQPRSSSPPRLCPRSADPAETSGTPHSGRCDTPPPPAAGHTVARKYFRCGRPLPSTPSGCRPFPPLPLSRATSSPAVPHATPRYKSTAHRTPPAPAPAAVPPRLPSAAYSVPAADAKYATPFFDPPQHRRGAVSQHPPNGAQVAPFNIHRNGLGPGLHRRPRPTVGPAGYITAVAVATAVSRSTIGTRPCASGWNRSLGSGFGGGKRGCVP